MGSFENGGFCSALISYRIKHIETPCFLSGGQTGNEGLAD